MTGHHGWALLWVCFWVLIPAVLWSDRDHDRRRRDDAAPGDATRPPRRHFGMGIALILLGLLLAFAQWRMVPFDDFSSHWPLILVALGVGKLVDRGLLCTGAHWLILIGAFFELEQNGPSHLMHRIWPLGLVWIGLIMTLRALRSRPARFPG